MNGFVVLGLAAAGIWVLIIRDISRELRGL
jgi:hypothetical protein